MTLRLEGPLAHILSGGTVVRTVACPAPGPPQLLKALQVKRRVSVRGAIMIGGQRIQVGLPHAGQTVEADTYQITVEDGITVTAPRKPSRDIKRHKASNYDIRRPEPMMDACE